MRHLFGMELPKGCRRIVTLPRLSIVAHNILADADCVRTLLINPVHTFDPPSHGLAGHVRQADHGERNGGPVSLTQVCVRLP